MNWSAYASFLAFAAVLVLIPGPDFAVVTRNTLAGGRGRGLWCAAGVSTSNAVQGLVAAAGLGTVVVRIEPLFLAVKWAGIGYLMFLAAQAFRSARRGEYALTSRVGGSGRVWRGWRQGFLSNITNPKVLVFYLAVLPQFLGHGATITALAVFALSHALLSLSYLSTVVALLHHVRRALQRRRVRRGLDVLTGTALLGFGTVLAIDTV